MKRANLTRADLQIILDALDAYRSQADSRPRQGLCLPGSKAARRVIQHARQWARAQKERRDARRPQMSLEEMEAR